MNPLSRDLGLSDLGWLPLIMIFKAQKRLDPCIQMIMVSSEAQLIMVRMAGGGALAVTMVTPRSGFDLEYYLDRAGGEKTAGGYYLNAAQEGEPPGRWFGKGAEALGFADGHEVERDPYLAAYQQTDPVTGEQLRRAPVGYKRFGQIFAAKLAAEPHATWERRLELEREAGRRRAGRPCTRI